MALVTLPEQRILARKKTRIVRPWGYALIPPVAPSADDDEIQALRSVRAERDALLASGVSYKVVTVPEGAIGADTSETITAAQATYLKSIGVTFITLYVAQSYQNPAYGTSAATLAAVTGAGLGVMLVQYPRLSDFSSQTGMMDGAAAARNALAIGYPSTANLWCDFEGAVPTAQLAIDYNTGWWNSATSGGFDAMAPGVYVGTAILNSSQLEYSLPYHGYWRAASQGVPNVDSRGYKLIQLWKGNVVVQPGLVIDYDVAQQDFASFNYQPMMCVRA